MKKAIYGLRQAPRAWHAKLKSVLVGLGFRASLYDAALFYRGDGANRVWIDAYVDDLLAAGRDKAEIQEIKRALMAVFDITDLGPVHTFLGMEVKRDRARRTLHLTQQRLATELVERHGLTDKANRRNLPLDPKTGASFVPAEEHELIDTAHVPLQRGHRLSPVPFCLHPPRPCTGGGDSCALHGAAGVKHWQAVKGVLRYLSGTIGFGLKWHPEVGTRGELVGFMDVKHGAPGNLVGYMDSNYAACLTTRRSTTGYVFLLHNAAISWRSQLQKATAQSTAEAEYMAAASAAKEAVALKSQLEADFGYAPAPARLFGDNQAAIALAKNPIGSERSKHIDVRYHFIREKVDDGSVTIDYVNTADMVADLLTKPLPLPAFSKGRRGHGGDLGFGFSPLGSPRLHVETQQRVAQHHRFDA